MKHILCAAVLVGFAASAAPLDFSPKNWDWNPIAWNFNASGSTVRSRGLNDFAVRSSPRCARVRISAKVTPRRVVGKDWATLGLALFDDDRNFWHVALVQAPPEQGGRHSFELAESRNGEWLSQNIDRLEMKRHRVSGSWVFDETYEIALASEPAGISAAVKNAKGETLFEMEFAFPKTEPGGKVKAVVCGRPALHANGGFAGEFSAIDADWSEPCASAGDAGSVPPYASDSFVPGVNDRATGFFRVMEKDGRWWVIDPLGRGTVLLGVDHVTYHGHYSERTKRSDHLLANRKRFPNKADWEEDALERLKAWGFNLLGAGCDNNLKHRGLIHTAFLSIGDKLCPLGGDPELYICPNERRPCSAFPNVFHPDFPVWADYRARKQCTPNRDDPWLFGYFIDNELAWWGRGASDTGLFDAVAKLPETHSARIAQRKFLAERGITGNVPAEVKLDFLRRAAELYFSISCAAIRRYDPNHLVMGARFAGLGGAHPVVWETAGKYCDVVTFNCYPWADLDRNVVMTDQGRYAERVTEAFSRRYEIVKRPMLITEWSFPALDSGLPCTGGAGQRFQTQALRTQATELFARTMLSLPFFVGYDYFMWVDEPAEGMSDAFPEDSNYGLINGRGEAYPEITGMFAKLHRNIGEVRTAGIPPERPAPKSAVGKTSEEFLSRAAAERPFAYVRKGDRYEIRNAAGMELSGKTGAGRIFDSVKLNGVNFGSYGGLRCERVNGESTWRGAGRVMSVDGCESDGRFVLNVTCEDRASKERGMATRYAITVFRDRPWFVCDLVSAKNIGHEAIDVHSFYFQEFSSFPAAELQSGKKRVPNLWKAPMSGAWIRSSDGAYYGGVSLAPTATSFTYWLRNGNEQHPDAQFAPEKQLALKPGEAYEPHGRMWMLSVCGFGGAAGWENSVESLTRAGDGFVSR